MNEVSKESRVRKGRLAHRVLQAGQLEKEGQRVHQDRQVSPESQEYQEYQDEAVNLEKLADLGTR